MTKSIEFSGIDYCTKEGLITLSFIRLELWCHAYSEVQDSSPLIITGVPYRRHNVALIFIRPPYNYNHN